MSNVRITPGQTPGVQKILAHAFREGKAVELVNADKRRLAAQIGPNVYPITNRGVVEGL